MNEAMMESIQESCAVLHLNLTGKEFAAMVTEQSLSEETVNAMEQLLLHLRERKRQATVQTLLRLSRLPLQNPRTFDNFNFSLIHGKDTRKLEQLRTLSAVYAHKNIALIGPPGTGKTHLAQAFGYSCCQNGLKTYFIKMTELNDRFHAARQGGKTARLLNMLVRPSCLIIDEVGHCELDKENTRMFFDLIDRRYNKQGAFNMIFTSNKNPSEWRSSFNEDDALLCALDRIFDDAMVFLLRGNSFRGQQMETFTVQTEKQRLAGSVEQPRI